MKNLKYVSLIALLFGTLLCSCYDEADMFAEGGDEEEDDPIEIPPPSSGTSNSVPLDSLTAD